MSDDVKTTVRRLVMQAIYDVVASTGTAGAPAGVVYAALSQHGCSMQVYQAFEDALCEVGVLKKQANLLFAQEQVAREVGLAK